MPEQPDRPTPWFHKINEAVLGQAGPGRRTLKGADIYAGEPMPRPGDNKTQDLYAQGEKLRGR